MGNFKERKTISTWSSKQIWIERQNFNFVTYVTRKRADEYRIEERISFYLFFFSFKNGGLLLKCRVLVDNVWYNVQVSQTNFIACRYIMQLNGTLREIVSKERPPFFFFCSSASWYIRIFLRLCVHIICRTLLPTEGHLCVVKKFYSPVWKSVLLVHFFLLSPK